MQRSLSTILVILLLASASAADPKFTQPPRTSLDGNKVTLTFTVDSATDVTVAVVDESGAILQPVASGLLGPAAPAPFKTDSLEQTLQFDLAKGIDPAAASIRVSLRLQPAFELAMGPDRARLDNVHALATAPNGDLFVLTDSSVVVFDRNGKYLRQIVPHSADLSPRQLSGLEPVALNDGSTLYRRSVVLPRYVCGSMAVSPDGKHLYIPGPNRYARRLTKIGTDGSVPADAFAVRLTTHADNGMLYVACSHDGKTLYMAGAEAGYQGDDARLLSYRHQLYRLRLDAGDGPAEALIGDDENRGGGFWVDRPKGIAVDAAGRVYLCNYGSGNVAVYTPRGGLLKSLPIKFPQQVAVNPKTGHVYVLCGSEAGRNQYNFDFPPTWQDARLVRFSPDGKLELDLAIDPPFAKTRKDPKTGQPTTQPEFRLRLAADFSDAAKPVVWVGVSNPAIGMSKFGLLRYEDLGDRFSQPVDVASKSGGAVRSPTLRMVLDRRNDVLYLLNSGNLVRIRGDGTTLPGLKPFDKDGARPPWNVLEPAIGPDGLIYYTSWDNYAFKNGFLRRMDADGKPVPFSAADKDWPAIGYAMKGGTPKTARGVTVAPNGDIFVLRYDENPPANLAAPEPWDRAFDQTTVVDKYSPDGKLVGPRIVGRLRFGAMGVRVDSRGNVYVADNMRPVGVNYPAAMAGVLDDPMKRPYPARIGDAFDEVLRYNGCLLKFGPEGGKIVGLPEDDVSPPTPQSSTDLYRPAPPVQWLVRNQLHVRVTGSLWQYLGINPIPAEYQGVTHVERCVCWGARFDIDPFDRIYVPDCGRSRINVLDSNGNLITRVGHYGNLDATGLGVLRPANVAAAGDHFFIADAAVGRIIRVKDHYAAQAVAPIRK